MLSNSIPGHNAPIDDNPTSETPVNDANDDPDYEHATTNAPRTKTQKKRTRKNETVKDKKDVISAKNQASLEQFTRPSRAQHDVKEAIVENTLEEDLNLGRRKRRKTESPGPLDVSTAPVAGLNWHQQLQVEANAPAALPTGGMLTEDIVESTVPLMRFTSPLPAVAEPVDVETSLKTTPKKQIKITKSGKLMSSPPKPSIEESTTPKRRQGRKPAKAKILPTVTIIKYGTDSANRLAFGGKIEAILSGIKSTTKRRTKKIVEPPKVTHPFFSGKPGQKIEVPAPAVAQPPPTPRKSAITPGKLFAEIRRDRSPGPTPAFGMSLGSNRGPKQSGLLEASWPSRETAHVRNRDSNSVDYAERDVTAALPLRARKLKGRVVSLKDDEDLISRLARDLADDMRTATKEENFDFVPPEDVRLPTRLLTTGVEIQRRVRTHLKATPNLHPAILALFNDIEHTLTPFDEGRCESQTWVQKYGPKCASHVLQNGKDATVLKDWLQSLTVLAVGGAQNLSRTEPSDGKKPPRKKRKKAVDNFIVSDDEEEDEDMVEVTDAQLPLHLKSFRRPRWTRNNNVILLSGPHGSGKSATVYAVAKELDFEVFEINAGMRRSGKDIQDKVGDMTANHLVNHKRPEAPTKEDVAPLDDAGDEQISKALQKDIASGRQGTMMNFFKSTPASNANSKPKAKPKPVETKPIFTAATQAMLPQLNASRKSQKQSLILFEEADILFAEDQQFWAQVTSLAAQSKRPIIITCNDERQIPVHDLPLAAMLRLQPPAVDLATDYMLALAGREGHVLERQAVDDMYRSKNHDLRASITELHLWCQMSVGDRKGGLEWMYQRWPPGKDVDAEGRVLRVASVGTYLSGMGYISHNVFETKSNTVFDKEAELSNEIWSDWGISPHNWLAQPSSPETLDTLLAERIQTLKDLEAFTDTLSSADVYCRVGLPSYRSDRDQPADSTSSPITEKASMNYTLAAPLLQADHQTDFLQFDTSIYTHTQLLAQRAFPALSGFASPPSISKPTSEADYAKSILSHRSAQSKDISLSRQSFSQALDVLAALPDQTLPERTSFLLTPSSFDRTFSIITLDLAPYVRSIVAHEQILESQRIRMSNLLSGGGTGKRARTTRASRVALEGGVRETKRRDRWFSEHLNFQLVMATAGKQWSGMGWRNEEEDGGEGEGEGEGMGSVTGTQESVGEREDVIMCDVEEGEE